MQNPESVLDNEMHKLLWGVEWETDHQISVRRPDRMIANKKKKKKIDRTYWTVEFAISVDPSVKKQSGKKHKYLDLASELEKLWNMKVTVKPIVIGALQTVPKEFVKKLKDLEIWGCVDAI